MHIDGETELVGIIGYPISYTLSPVIHNAAFCDMKMNWLYVPLRVPPGEAGLAVSGLRALGFKGANVTIPHKVESARFLEETKGDAGILGAVNTVVRKNGRLVGYNTDAEGFAAFLGELGVRVRGASAMLIGAGGASRAVALAMAREGASKIFIMNRTPGKAEDFAALLKRAAYSSEISERTFDYRGARVMRECGVIVNCTPLAGEDKGELPLDYSEFREGQWALDLNYSRPVSAFMKGASSRGARTANGEGMLIHQAAASFRLWTGKNPPIKVMREAFGRATAAD